MIEGVMVMRVIDEKDFPAIVEIYNSKGRLAANAYIRESYGIKTPWSVMKRIRKTPGFEYDAEENAEVYLVNDNGENIGEGVIEKITKGENKTNVARVKALNI